MQTWTRKIKWIVRPMGPVRSKGALGGTRRFLLPYKDSIALRICFCDALNICQSAPAGPSANSWAEYSSRCL